MYGTLARYRVKRGMLRKLREFEAEIGSAGTKGLVAEFTLSTDVDADICYKLAIFESKEAYDAVADDPEQDRRYHRLLELLDGPPEWHDGEIIHAKRA